MPASIAQETTKVTISRFLSSGATVPVRRFSCSQLPPVNAMLAMSIAPSAIANIVAPAFELPPKLAAWRFTYDVRLTPAPTLRGPRGAPYKRGFLWLQGPSMSTDFAAQRAIMVESQVRTQDVTDYAIQDAMRTVAREALLPAQSAYLAYADAEAPYAPGRWMLRPMHVAKLLQAIRPLAGEQALAIAAPYAAAVMEAMGVAVTRQDAGGLEGSDQAAVNGQYAIVVCEGAVTKAPAAWTDALLVGGRLGCVERLGPIGRAVLYLRSERDVGRRDLFDCAPPIMAGFEPKPAFSF
jgi:protein-L-isoaspartate(D-aspartate) O-methyltransferase